MFYALYEQLRESFGFFINLVRLVQTKEKKTNKSVIKLQDIVHFINIFKKGQTRNQQNEEMLHYFTMLRGMLSRLGGRN